MRWSRYLLFSICLLVGALVVSASPVSAVGVLVEPAFQFVTVTASDSAVTRPVTFTNQTEQPQQYFLSTIDIRQIDESGQVAFVDKPQTADAYVLATFLELPITEMLLEGGESRTLDIVIKDNQNLSPGGHYGAILAQVVSQGNEGEQVVVPAISAVLLVHKVGGERFHLNLKPLELETLWWNIPRSLQLTFENQGNVHVIPHGQVIITDIFGRRVAEGTINESSFLVMPETQRILSTNLASRGWPVPLIPLTVKVAGVALPGELGFGQSVTVWYVQLPGLIAIGIMLLIIGLLMRRIRRGKKSTH